MNTADLYINNLERQNTLLLHAARAASARIAEDRAGLYQCHFDPVAGDVVDEPGMAGLAEYDEVLGILQRAITATEYQPPFEGLVIFEFSQHGWRVIDFEEIGVALRPIALHQMTVASCQHVLAVCGTFHRRPRRNTFCKRPHKEIVHA